MLSLAVALLLLGAGGLALQQHSGGARAEAQGHDAPWSITGVDHAAPDSVSLLASGEALDSDETLPVSFEHLNALALGLFLVSLGLLLGAGLVGRGAEQRLLTLLRLPSVVPRNCLRTPLSVLEVFRL